jgi:hypothetical protein
MKISPLPLAFAALTAPAFSQSAAAPEPLAHIRTTFDFVVHAPLSVAMPLFGPDGERAWAGKHWDPKFLYPQPGRDVEGAVFTIHHGGMNAVWVNTLFDAESRHFQYVYFVPELLVTVIDVRFKPLDAESTAVNVVYTRTAVTPEGNEHVKALGEGDSKSGTDWQRSIEAYLAARGAIAPR